MKITNITKDNFFIPTPLTLIFYSHTLLKKQKAKRQAMPKYLF